MGTWELVVFIFLGIFGAGAALFSGYRLGGPDKPQSTPVVEVVVQAANEAKNKLTNASVEVKAPDEAPVEKSAALPEETEQTK